MSIGQDYPTDHTQQAQRAIPEESIMVAFEGQLGRYSALMAGMEERLKPVLTEGSDAHTARPESIPLNTLQDYVNRLTRMNSLLSDLIDRTRL